MPKNNVKSKHRQKTFDDMTPETRNLATQFEQQLEQEHHDGLLLRHAMGVTLARVIAGEATYGSNAVEQLAAYLGMCPDRLYKLRTYADVYTEAQIGGGRRGGRPAGAGSATTTLRRSWWSSRRPSGCA